MDATPDLLVRKSGATGPTFTLRNRLLRAVWGVSWLLLCRWTPPQLHVWRIFVLRAFGADVSYRAKVYSNVAIWAPWNLVMEDYSTLGRGVNCYNIAEIKLERFAIVSQGANLCTGSHDFNDPNFRLISKPIHLRENCWICAYVLLCPGTQVGSGAIVGAGSVARGQIEQWSIYVGNPATYRSPRQVVYLKN